MYKININHCGVSFIYRHNAVVLSVPGRAH